jgi:putative oxidoreductase
MSERTKLYGVTWNRFALATITLAHGLANSFGWFGGPGIHELSRDFARHVSMAPDLIAWIVSLGQIVGGLLLLLGLGVRWIGLLLLVFFAAQMLVAGNYRAFFVERGGCEYLLALMAMAGIVATHGAGLWVVQLSKQHKE